MSELIHALEKERVSYIINDANTLNYETPQNICHCEAMFPMRQSLFPRLRLLRHGLAMTTSGYFFAVSINNAEYIMRAGDVIGSRASLRGLWP